MRFKCSVLYDKIGRVKKLKQIGREMWDNRDNTWLLSGVRRISDTKIRG